MNDSDETKPTQVGHVMRATCSTFRLHTHSCKNVHFQRHCFIQSTYSRENV